jgi:hypothetical protein
LVLVYWRQELEHRARDKYGTLDQMSADLRQLREQRDALDAFAEALGTQDGWLSYWAEALRDQLLEHEGQAAARPPAIERVYTALIVRIRVGRVRFRERSAGPEARKKGRILAEA